MIVCARESFTTLPQLVLFGNAGDFRATLSNRIVRKPARKKRQPPKRICVAVSPADTPK